MGLSPENWAVVERVVPKSLRIFFIGVRVADTIETALNAARAEATEAQARRIGELEGEVEAAEAVIDQIERALTDDEEPDDYNPTPVQRADDLWRAHKGIYASYRADVDRVSALESALHSAALNLEACAIAIKKGGKSEGRHTLVEGWAEQARALLSTDTKEPSDDR